MQISVEGMTVAIGMPIYDKPTAKTSNSLFYTAKICAEVGVKCDLIMVRGFIEYARDQVLDEFLKSPAQKLFWIDSDMVWHPDDFLKLLALSTKVDVVGCAYPQKIDGPTSCIATVSGATNELGLLPCDMMGLGFTVVDRAVCTKLANFAPQTFDALSGRKMASVFRLDRPGLRCTDDYNFFTDIKDAGFQVWLDPSIELGHVGEREWRGRLLDSKIIQPIKDE